MENVKMFLVIAGIETNPGPVSPEHITIAHLNINSITSFNRLEELEQFTTLNHIDILALTETKLDNNVHPSLFHLQGFSPPLLNHRNRHGGGTAIYAKTSLSVTRLHTLELAGEEWIWACIRIRDLTLLVCCVYLPPNLSALRHQQFIDHLTESAAMANAYSPTSLIILGDMNAGNIFLSQPTQRHSGITTFDVMLKDAIDTLDLKPVRGLSTVV